MNVPRARPMPATRPRSDQLAVLSSTPTELTQLSTTSSSFLVRSACCTSCWYWPTPMALGSIFTSSALRRALTLALGAIGRVRKQRTLYLVGRTRVHLDRVEGLGEFLELEVVLRDDETAEVGEAEAHALMGELGIVPAQLVEGAYLDLLGAATD